MAPNTNTRRGKGGIGGGGTSATGYYGSLLPVTSSSTHHRRGCDHRDPATTTTTTTNDESNKDPSFSLKEDESLYNDMEQKSLIASSSLRHHHHHHHHHQQQHNDDSQPPPRYYHHRDNENYKESSHQQQQQWRNTWMGIVGGVIIGLLLPLLIQQPQHQSSSSSTSGEEWSSLYSSSSSSSCQQQQRLEVLLQNQYYDYIVVGGGPSGIITATKLAKKLPPTSKIILLESGSVSQSNVPLQHIPTPPRTTHNDDQQPHRRQNNNNLNEYDIPLMWSGIANTQRRYEESFHLQPSPQFSTYWPISLALLTRGLGGCGLHNAMIYIRSLPTCFQSWGNLTNWSFQQMIPMYQSLENYRRQPSTPTTIRDDSKTTSHHRGLDGPIRTIPSGPGWDSMGDYFIHAAQASGLPLSGGRQRQKQEAANGDDDDNDNDTTYFNGFNPQDRIGVGYYEFNIKNGIRHSVANAMLGSSSTDDDENNSSNKIPSNLFVLTGCTVTQVLWSSKTNTNNNKSRQHQHQSPPQPRAIGVTYVDTTSGNRGKILLKQHQHHQKHQSSTTDSSTTTTTAHQPEVLLTTGAIMTPQILWNSGIGDGGSLVHLPGVGKNLQDHPVLGIAYQINLTAATTTTTTTTTTTQPQPVGLHQMYALADEMEDYKLAAQFLNELDEKEKGRDDGDDDDKEQQPKPSKTRTSADINVDTTNSTLQEDDDDETKRSWAFEKLGILGTAGFSAGGFLKSPWAGESAPPDIQLTVFPRIVEPHQPKSKKQIDVKFMRERAMLITVALLEPEARYEVQPGHLLSSSLSSSFSDHHQHQQQHQSSVSSSSSLSDDNNQEEHQQQKTASQSAFETALQYPLPSIQLPKGKTEYLTDKDVQRLAWGIEQVRRIMSFPPMSNVTSTEIYPGGSVVNDANDDKDVLNEYIRANHLANSHWVGSTKMGKEDDPLAVLDESMKVRGVQGLRVLDSGAIPKVPNGNTHSTVCAVAARGVDLILQERGSL